MNRSRSEALTRKRLRPHFRDLLEIAADLEAVSRAMVSISEESEDTVLNRARAQLAGRLADDLRVMQIISLSGYPQQTATIGGSAYEVAFLLAFLGDDPARAREWLESVKSKELPWKLAHMVRVVVEGSAYDGPDVAKRHAVFYEVLCWFKHSNQLAINRFAPSPTALRHLLNSDPDVASPTHARGCFLTSLRGPVIALATVCDRWALPSEARTKLERAMHSYAKWSCSEVR